VPVALSCPPVSRLKDLALGLVREEETTGLEQHVLSCSACARAMEQVIADDGLVDALRHAAGAKIPHGSHVNSAIERACRLHAGVQVTGSTDRLKRRPFSARKRHRTLPR
jgi:hypothetical protein